MSSCRRYALIALLLCLVGTAVFVAGFGLGRYVFPSSDSRAWQVASEQRQQFSPFWEAWRIIEDEYYTEQPLDYQAMTYGAARGMVASLGDPHTAFLTPEEADMFSQDLTGTFGGIGVTITPTDDGFVQVVKLIPGGPAEKTVLQPGDVVLAVDGTSIHGMSQNEAIALIRGEVGTQVTLRVRHEGQEMDLTLTRAIIAIPVTERKMLDNNIAYLYVGEFNARAADLVKTDLTDLLKHEPRGLILDLRGDPGGYLHIVEQVADEFLPEGVLVIERSSTGAESRRNTTASGLAESIPLVVLVDGGSASASEILAGAVQDRGRGVLIGERTYGKGSVQVTERLSDRSAVAVTIRRWFTPADRAIDGKGLTPDIVVEYTEEDAKAGRDPQLDRAIKYLMENTAQ